MNDETPLFNLSTDPVPTALVKDARTEMIRLFKPFLTIGTARFELATPLLTKDIRGS